MTGGRFRCCFLLHVFLSRIVTPSKTCSLSSKELPDDACDQLWTRTRLSMWRRVQGTWFSEPEATCSHGPENMIVTEMLKELPIETILRHYRKYSKADSVWRTRSPASRNICSAGVAPEASRQARKGVRGCGAVALMSRDGEVVLVGVRARDEQHKRTDWLVEIARWS